MKTIVIVIFDSFTDIDLFLMWDILGRNTNDWKVRILGTKAEHVSAHGLSVKTHGHVSETNDADVVLFSSGKLGVKEALNEKTFVSAFAYSTDRGHPFQADHGQRSGRSRTPWVGYLSDGLDRNASVRHHGGTLCASCAGEGPGYPCGALAPGG